MTADELDVHRDRLVTWQDAAPFDRTPRGDHDDLREGPGVLPASTAQGRTRGQEDRADRYFV